MYAHSLLEKFFEKKNTKDAFRILDVVDEEVEFDVPGESKKKIKLTNDFLIGALSTFAQKELNDDEEIIVRTILGDFFDDLGMFQSHIDAGLIKLRDIKPYLEYWFRELTGRGRVHDDPRLGVQVAKHLRYFGYIRVLALAEGVGYPFPKKP